MVLVGVRQPLVVARALGLDHGAQRLGVLALEGRGDLERTLLVGTAEDAADRLVGRAEALEGFLEPVRVPVVGVLKQREYSALRRLGSKVAENSDLIAPLRLLSYLFSYASAMAWPCFVEQAHSSSMNASSQVPHCPSPLLYR